MFKRMFQAILVLTVAPTVLAADYSHTRLFLMIQEQGEPLFRPVELSIYRLEKWANKTLIYKSVRHTAALNLPAGQYMAHVNYQNRLVRHTFELVNHEESYVAVELNLASTTQLSAR